MASKNPDAPILGEGIRVSRTRSETLVRLLVRGKEVVIRSHGEPEALRAYYPSNMAAKMLEEHGKQFDPIGRIAWLREVDELLEELGVEGG